MRSVTTVLIVLNVVAFLAQQVVGDAVLAPFKLWPVGTFYLPELGRNVGFEVWQLFTSAFLHANVQHLFFNMFALFMFGASVEKALGSGRFGLLYFAAVLSGALTQLYVVTSGYDGSPPVPTLGASGGVFGVMLAFGWLFPRRRVTLLFPPIPMPAWLFVTLYGLIELTSGVMGTQSGVAHFAHLGGMLGAALVLLGSGGSSRLAGTQND